MRKPRSTESQIVAILKEPTGAGKNDKVEIEDLRLAGLNLGFLGAPFGGLSTEDGPVEVRLTDGELGAIDESRVVDLLRGEQHLSNPDADTLRSDQGRPDSAKHAVCPDEEQLAHRRHGDLVRQGRVIHYNQEGLALTIDRNKLTEKGAAEAIRALEGAISQMRE